jgi:hypothetical protein
MNNSMNNSMNSWCPKHFCNQLAVADFFSLINSRSHFVNHRPRLHAAGRLQQQAKNARGSNPNAPIKATKWPGSAAPAPIRTLSTRARAPQVVEANAGLGVQFG